jgi:hypothetical protein
MASHTLYYGNSKKDCPHKEVSGKFLRKGQGIMKDIPENNLGKDKDEHGTHGEGDNGL